MNFAFDAPSPPKAAGMRTIYCAQIIDLEPGSTTSVCGWVARRREHGEHLAFLDVRDHTGIVQCVIEAAQALRAETVVRVTGTVRLRPEGTVNPALVTGSVELGDCTVEVLGESEPVPFAINGRADTDEAVRLKYRFLDLRSDRMQQNLRLRAAVISAMRRSMESQSFVEIETPLLWTPTPEGAREFAIPSRLQRGSFYVLPQSPQIAKQLAMVGGFDRYFQVARCLRDEDLRADRQFEFTQLDIEASFVGEADIRGFVTQAVVAAGVAAGVDDLGNADLGPESGADREGQYRVIETMTWREAMDRFGTDKPDLRFGMELVDLTSALAGTAFKAFQAPSVRAIVLAGGGSSTRARLDSTIERAKELGALGLVWMKVVEGPDGAEVLESPVAKFLTPVELEAIRVQTKAKAGDLVLIVASEWRTACEVLGQLRVDFGRPAVGEGGLRFCWVVDFPMFDGTDDDGNLLAAHHPFTMPHPDDMDRLVSDPLSVRAQSYDLVLNGWELGSGSIRIHRRDIQGLVFSALGISDEQAEERFGFMLGAFAYGAPPHGGFAVGIDRLVAIMAGEENIREVIAFPKTQSGADLMTGAPKPLAAKQLAELGIGLAKSNK